MKTDNELIREFMGIKTRILPNGGFPVEMWYREGDYDNFFSPFDYSKEWNHIMPVVEKIEKIKGVCVYMETGTSCFITSFGKVIARGKDMPTKIQSVYKAVLAFIKWYNTQTTQRDDQ